MRTKYLERYSTDKNSVYIGDNGYFYTTFGPNKLNKKSRRVRSSSGKLYSRFKINGKKVELSIHNEVAKAFIPNPNNYRNVLFKDNNIKNISYHNLYWFSSNGMDYSKFSKVKTGMLYKIFKNEIIGSYKVTSEDSNSVELKCTTCNSFKVINRNYISSTKGICSICKDRSLDIPSLYSEQFLGWVILKEDNTENLITSEKVLIIKCKCCNQEDKIPYSSFKSKKLNYYCGSIKEKRSVLIGRIGNMKQRCYNHKNKSYKRYGGRGITVCYEWLNDTESFIKWALDNNFTKEFEIDRKNSNGSYSPENCQLLTSEQHRKNHK
jgi:hypothetical protein